MRDIVIVGAGIGGLAAALALGRQGRRVIVCERDAAPVPASTEEMWCAWPRPGTAHAPLGHGFLPGFRALLRERAPDVLERLWEAGAPPFDCAADLPGTERLAEDAEMTGIMCRRAILEGILRQVVQAEPAVELRAGCAVGGLVAEPSSVDGVPRVTGVRTRDGGAIAAECVIVSGGRLMPVRRWLDEIDAESPAEADEGCGFGCYTRYFRIRLDAGEDHRVATQLTTISDLGFMKYSFFGADQGTFCVEFLVPAWDPALRGLREEAAFMAAARLMPEGSAWLDPERSTPIGPIAAIGQERNLRRDFVRDGRPLALGLHVIGDARCQTNSEYAWGAGLALAEAMTVADLLTEQDGDVLDQALAFEARLGEEIAGRHRLAVERDRACMRAYRGEAQGDAAATEDGGIEALLGPAASEDATVFRAVRRREMQLDPFGALARNAAVLDRARALAAVRQSAPEPERRGPTRDELLHVIAESRQRVPV